MRLFKGVRKFHEMHKEEADFYGKLAEGQSPDVLFFACSDSRVDPNLITQSRPGELFIVKSIGNIIPSESTPHKKSCAAAAIEFSLMILNVKHIIVCGHSDCGAIRAFYYEEKDFDGMPNLKNWISTASCVTEKVTNHCEADCHARMEMTEKENIILQLENLKSYPLVSDAVKQGRVKLHGWYYDIAKGTVFEYNEKKCVFEPITDAEPPQDCCGGHK